jgi:hypothetical protein
MGDDGVNGCVPLMAWKIFGAKRHPAISHQKKNGDSKTLYPPATGGRAGPQNNLTNHPFLSPDNNHGNLPL